MLCWPAANSQPWSSSRPLGGWCPAWLGNAASSGDESFAAGLLEYPHWTRPASFRGLEAPEVLRSGDHARVRRWRQAMAIVRTARERPDLLAMRGVSDLDRELLAEFDLELGESGSELITAVTAHRCGNSPTDHYLSQWSSSRLSRESDRYGKHRSGRPGSSPRRSS